VAVPHGLGSGLAAAVRHLARVRSINGRFLCWPRDRRLRNRIRPIFHRRWHRRADAFELHHVFEGEWTFAGKDSGRWRLPDDRRRERKANYKKNLHEPESSRRIRGDATVCPGSAPVSRAGDCVSQSRTFLKRLFRRDAETNTRDACATRSSASNPEGVDCSLDLRAKRFARHFKAQSFHALKLILRPFFEPAEIHSLQRRKIRRDRP
jgi:hypothetical protein